MTQDPISAGRIGRSSLRRIDLEHIPRKRPFLFRIGLVLCILTILGSIVVSTVTQAFSPNSPFAIIYWLHDHIWLVIKGNLWTAVFPWSLPFAVPLVIAIFVLALEWLTPLSTLGLHRRAILAWFGSPFSHSSCLRPPTMQMLATRMETGLLSPPALPGGMMRRVAHERWAAIWQELRVERLQGTVPDTTRLLKMENTIQAWLQRDPVDLRGHLAWLESVAATPGREAKTSAARLLRLLSSSDAAKEIPIAALCNAAKPLSHDFTAIAADRLLKERLTVLDNWHPGSGSPVSLAADIVLVGAVVNRVTSPLGRIWMEELAALHFREATSDGASEIALAMTLVDHELWAWLAEEAAMVTTATGLLSTFGLAPDRAEKFALTGISR